MAKKQTALNEKSAPENKGEEILDKPDHEETLVTMPDEQEIHEDDQGGDSLNHSWLVELKREKIEEQIEITLKGYVAQVKLPGFRLGKVPFDVVKSRFYEAAEDEVVNKMLEEVILGHVRKENLNIIDSPTIEDLDRPQNGDVTAKVTVELAPELSLPLLSELECSIEKSGPGYEQFEEERELQKVLEANKRRLPVTDREIRDGDFVVLKFQSKNLENKRMTPRKESYFEVMKDGDHEIGEIYSDLIGKKNGETFSVIREYPADYQRTAWQSKKFEHQIEIFQHFEMQTPLLDDDFAKKHGYESLVHFKEKLKEEFDVYQKKIMDDRKTETIIQELVKSTEFKVPKKLMTQELSRIIQNPERYAHDFQQFENDRDALFTRIKADAERNVRFSFIIEKLIKEYSMNVSQEDLDTEYSRLAMANNADVKQVKKYYQDTQHREQLKDVLLKRKVIDYLRENVSVKEV